MPDVRLRRSRSRCPLSVSSLACSLPHPNLSGRRAGVRWRAAGAGRSRILGAGPIDVVVLERVAVGQQLLVGLARAERRLAELGDASRAEGLPDLRVCPEGP